MNSCSTTLRATALLRICGVVVLKEVMGEKIMTNMSEAQAGLYNAFVDEVGGTTASVEALWHQEIVELNKRTQQTEKKWVWAYNGTRKVTSQGKKRLEFKLPMKLPFMDGRFVAQRYRVAAFQHTRARLLLCARGNATRTIPSFPSLSMALGPLTIGSNSATRAYVP